MQAPHTSDVAEGFIHGVFFDDGGVVAHDIEHAPGVDAVGFIIAGQDRQFRTELAGIPERYPALDPESLGLVAGAGDNAAFLAGD